VRCSVVSRMRGCRVSHSVAINKGCAVVEPPTCRHQVTMHTVQVDVCISKLLVLTVQPLDFCLLLRQHACLLLDFALVAESIPPIPQEHRVVKASEGTGGDKHCCTAALRNAYLGRRKRTGGVQVVSVCSEKLLFQSCKLGCRTRNGTDGFASYVCLGNNSPEKKNTTTTANGARSKKSTSARSPPNQTTATTDITTRAPR